MFKIFRAHCRSNWKKNLMANWSGAFLAVLWMLMSINNHTGGRYMLRIAAMFVVILFLRQLLDVTVPETLYLCPYGFEDRKAYVRKAAAIQLLVSAGAVYAGLLVMGLVKVISGYALLVKGILVTIFLCQSSMEAVIPGFRSGGNQDPWGRMAGIIGWRDTLFELFYQIPALLVLLFVYEERLCLNPGNMIQWIFILGGLGLIHRFYKKHFHVFVAMAADYESYMKYQIPIRK